MNYLIKDIPAELWKKFKSKVALEGKTIKEIFIEFIKNYVGEK